MIIPFLFELRTLMDWIWTDTSMSLFDWIKMEDIFTNIYQMKVLKHFFFNFGFSELRKQFKLSFNNFAFVHVNPLQLPL